MAARNTSIDFFGVSRFSIDSLRADFTADDIEVQRPVVLPTKEDFTESDSLFATSAATFLDMSSVLNSLRMGARSSSVRTAPPVTFLTCLVNFLKSPPTRPVASSFFESSSSEPEDSDSTSASMSTSSPDPRNSACLAVKSASSSVGPPFEKSSSFMAFFDAAWPSQWRASLPFLGFSGSGSTSFFFAGLLLPVNLSRASLRLSASPSPSSSSSSPPLLFFDGPAMPFSC
mmetsp:Transcript_98798/g.175948  ORF Transcript_98798/g.175948 Transcript_98798/m.175948 type:complete len:230 (+) Transcript_98798:783-1472(+)